MINCPHSRLVETTYGPIIGRRLIHEGDKQVDAFQGIPYAKAPIGELRFKKPVTVESWNEIRETKTFGCRSIQKDFPGMAPPIPMSEDCLSLNIFSPVWEPSSKGFPVIFYVHGGVFRDSAYTYGDMNICENLVKKDVIVVTVQYRVGYLGLWTTGDKECPGNNLLWDLTLALKWVQDNITRFNGDPSNVTVIGQSGGGALVDFLGISPHSRDLFHKIVCMAGNSSDFWSLSYDSVELCRKFAEGLGVKTDNSLEMLEKLRELPSEDFAVFLHDVMGTDEYGLLKMGVGVRFDGDFFPRRIEELRTEAPHKPRIEGVCRDEGLIYMAAGPQEKNTIHRVAAARFTEKNYPTTFKRLREEYVRRVDDGVELQKAISQAHSDHIFTIGCLENVLKHLENGHPGIYLYVMDWFNGQMNGPITANAPFPGSYPLL